MELPEINYLPPQRGRGSKLYGEREGFERAHLFLEDNKTNCIYKSYPPFSQPYLLFGRCMPIGMASNIFRRILNW